MNFTFMSIKMYVENVMKIGNGKQSQHKHK